MVSIGIILLFFAIALIVVIYALQKEDELRALTAFIGALCFGLIFIGISFIDEYANPSITPLEVYRGNTTLEITYRDSIAIDSTVVWKEEVK